MSEPLITIDAYASIEEADRRMNEKQVRHLVVREKKKVVGIVSVRDLIWSLVQEKTVFSERRGYVRLPFTAMINYRDSKKEEYNALTFDINGGGLFIQTAQPLPIGSPITIEMNIPKSGKTIRSSGIVAWLRNTPREVMKADGKIVYIKKNIHKVVVHPGGMGVQFTDISEEDKVAIMEFVEEMSRKISHETSKDESHNIK